MKLFKWVRAKKFNNKLMSLFLFGLVIFFIGIVFEPNVGNNLRTIIILVFFGILIPFYLLKGKIRSIWDKTKNYLQ